MVRNTGAMRIAQAAAAEAMAGGAHAVVLTGSHARGDAAAHSDIDLVPVLRKAPGAGTEPPPYRVRRGYLVATAWTTPTAARAAFRDPALFPTYVPGWREAVILADPDGIAARIRARAQRWDWSEVADVTDGYVAEHITGWAEEVHKLADALDQGNRHTASMQRSLLAVHLAAVVALRRRILWGSDNVLHGLVAEQMGEPWASTQARAFGQGGEPHEEACRAALELFGLAAVECWGVLDRGQRAVVRQACGIAGVVVG